MPIAALPIPHGSPANRRFYRRTYQDPLGQPMSGLVTITSKQRLVADGAVLPAQSTAVAELADGVLEVQLQPGFYRLVATLTSPSGHNLTDTEDITITG